MIPREPGTYALLFVLHDHHVIKVRGGRSFDLSTGVYAYTGSARGPGGLAARLQRHGQGSPRKHWHIDYLLPHARFLGALVRQSEERLECDWAAWIADRPTACIDGFGASDCACPGHLFRVGRSGSEKSFVGLAQEHLGARFSSWT